MIKRGALPLLVATLVAGCGFLKPQQKAYYALEAIPPAAPAAAVAGEPIGIGSVELPPGIDRREIVIREADQRLALRGRELWASPLEAMVVHALAFDLANRLPEGMVVLPGSLKPAGAMRSLYVIMETFDAGPGTTLVLDARWSIGPVTPASTRRERIEIPLESLESPAIAEGMSRALGVLADRIVRSLGV
ncbi:MAG TPA: PqiC family protein [Thermoanaerobaculia bacterium]